MRVTRDESPKNEKYFIREKGEAFDQFNALSHSVRAPPPSVRPSVNPIQLGANSLDETRNTQQMLLFIIIIVFMQYNPSTLLLVSVFTVQSGTDGPPRPDPGRSKRLQQYLIYDNCVGGRRRRRQKAQRIERGK
jgi:hypothetical protein